MRLYILTIVTAGLAGVILFAPTTSPPPSQEQPAFTSEVECLVIATTVADKPGQYMIQCPDRPVADFYQPYPNEHLSEGATVNVTP